MKLKLYDENYNIIKTIYFVHHICTTTNKVFYYVKGESDEEKELIKNFDYKYIHIYED